MKEKVVLITGGNSGIGKATATALLKMGATVIIACRSKEKGEQAIADIKKASGSSNVELLLMDLASQRSIRDAVAQFKTKHNKLHVLINNAGVFIRNREETEDGLEKTFATNYLSHFLLTHLLLDTLKASAPARIINVASKHSGIKMNFDDLQTKNNYSFMKAVGPTKLGLILFTKKLAKQLEGTGITVNALHPGLAKSNLLHDMPFMVRFLFNLMMTTSEKCAETSVYLASSPEVEKVSGKYFEKCTETPTQKNANNEEAINKLWDISMKLCNL